MTDFDARKSELKKLSARAVKAKMDLHDLSEELPVNWDRIPEVSQVAYDAFAALERKRAELKQADNA